MGLSDMNTTRQADKRMATLAARYALAGITLHRIESDRGEAVYVAARWAMTREFRTMDEVERWIEMVAPTNARAQGAPGQGAAA